MKLKHVFLSGLLMSVGFAACTNDDFTEVSSPVNANGAISLGENFTIEVEKVGGLTRSAFEELPNGSYSPYWEKDDKLGAAWVHMVTAYDANYNVTACSNIGSNYGQFYSNHPFELTAGEGTNGATFTTITNAFAGAYALYYPYDPEVAMTGDEIPVAIKSYEIDCEEGKTLENINENMFSYCPVKFVPGGNQTGVFKLQQIPVLFTMYFKADPKLNMDLSAGGITIKNIVIMAKDANGDVLSTVGHIVPTNGYTIGNDNYNEVNGKDLNKILTYEGTDATDHLFITVNNSDNDDYKLLEKDVPTKKPFTFSILPFNNEATSFTVKVVTDKGVYAKNYNSTADASVFTELKKATQEGGWVNLGVILDVTEQNDVIYTAEEFMNRWNAAVAANSSAPLEIGTPLTLTEGLTCDNVDSEVIVKGHKLTVPSVNFTKAKGIKFENELVVEGNVFTSGSSEIEADNLSAKNIEIQGTADLKIKDAEKLVVASSGVVELAAPAGTAGKIGSVILEEGSTYAGNLTLYASGLSISSINSADKAVLTLAENFTNPANTTLTLGVVNTGTYSITNNGTINLNAAVTGTIENNSTLNVNADNSFELNNNASGTVNVNGTLTANTGKVVTNEGTINVYGNLTEIPNEGLIQTEATAKIIAKNNNAVITMKKNGTALAGGYIFILVDGNIVNETNEPTAYDMQSATASIPSKAETVFVNCGIKASQMNNVVSKKAIICSNVTLDQDLTFTKDFTVAGNVSMKSDVQGAARILTLEQTATNKVNAGATLTLSGDITLKGSTWGTGLTLGGTFNRNGATVDSTISLK